jgi:alanine-synthesizing transaminase
MFVWSEIPGPYADMGSLDFSIHLLERAGVAVSPGVGFGPSGEGFVRFALVDDNDRIETATQRIADSLDLL